MYGEILSLFKDFIKFNDPEFLIWAVFQSNLKKV